MSDQTRWRDRSYQMQGYRYACSRVVDDMLREAGLTYV